MSNVCWLKHGCNCFVIGDNLSPSDDEKCGKQCFSKVCIFCFEILAVTLTSKAYKWKKALYEGNVKLINPIKPQKAISSSESELNFRSGFRPVSL